MGRCASTRRKGVRADTTGCRPAFADSRHRSPRSPLQRKVTAQGGRQGPYPMSALTSLRLLYSSQNFAATARASSVPLPLSNAEPFTMLVTTTSPT